MRFTWQGMGWRAHGWGAVITLLLLLSVTPPVHAAAQPGATPARGPGAALPGAPLAGLVSLLTGLGLLGSALLLPDEDSAADSGGWIAQAFEQAPVGIALLDANYIPLSFNAAFSTLLGAAPDLNTQPFTAQLHPNDRDPFEYMAQETLQGRATNARVELRCLRPDGQITWLRVGLSSASKPGTETPRLMLYMDDYTIQKEMERAFWEQILRNDMILQSASDGFCLFRLDGTIIEANAAFAAMTGYSQEIMMGMPISSLQDDTDHRPTIMDQVPLVQAGNNPRFETSLRHQAGPLVLLSANLNLIDTGSQQFLFLSVRNTTEMQAAQQALRESRQMLQLVLDSIPTRVFWKDRDLRYLGCNRAFAEDAGLKNQHAIVGMTDFEMPWKAQAEVYRRADMKVINTGEALTDLEEAQQRADGNRYLLRTSKLPLCNPDGAFIGVMGTYEDITERQVARDRLEQSEARLQSIFNSAAAGILLMDAAGNFLHFNRQWAEMLGYEPGEMYSLDLWEVTLPEDRPLSRRKLQMLAAGELDSYALEKRYLRKDGTTLWARVSVSPIQDEAGELVTAVAMITDITERKQAEQAMYASESQYRSLFEDMPIGLFELDFSAVKTALDQIKRRHPDLTPHDYFYGHPDNVLACLGKLDLLNANRAALNLFEAAEMQEMATHLLHSFQEEAFEDFRLVLISLAENKFATTLEAMLQTVHANQRAVSLHVTVMPQYEDTWARVLIAVQDITARLEAQLALRESEERYRRLFEDVPISLWEEDFSDARRFIRLLRTRGVTDFEAHFNAHPADLKECVTGIKILDVNRHTLQMYNSASKEDFLGAFFRLLPPEEYDTMQEELVALAAGHYQISLEAKRRIAGVERYLAINLSVAPGYENTWGRVLVSLTDITRQKAAEAAEHEQRTLAEALRDTAAALVGSLDPEIVLDRILDNLGQVVPHDAANIGLVEGDAVHIHSWRGYHELMTVGNLRLSLNYPTFQRMYTTGEPLLASDVTQMAEWSDTPVTAWVKSYVGVPVRAHGQVVGFLNLDSAQPGFFTEKHVERLQAFADQAAIAVENAQLYDEIRQHAADLQRRVEQRTIELEHERAQLKAILDAMGEGLVYTEDQHIRYVNDHFLTMLGYDLPNMPDTVKEVLSQHFQLQNVDLTANCGGLMHILHKRRLWRGDARAIRRDGETFDASLTITLVGSLTDQPVSMVTVVRDVSQERALEAQKDRFIANASHELRTPIANMKMRLYLLEKQPARQPEHMQVLHYVTDRMSTLVEELLDISRFERGVISLERRVVDLRALVEHVVTVEQPTVQEKRLKLVAHLPAEALTVHIDTSRITQVLTNLVANAINYTSAEGQITVQGALEEHEAVVRVSDTGIGIPDDALSQIFEPFYRVNEEVARGTGLGLTISREIIDLHGGSLSVESQVNVGSTFTLRLPLYTPGTE